MAESNKIRTTFLIDITGFRFPDYVIRAIHIRNDSSVLPNIEGIIGPISVTSYSSI